MEVDEENYELSECDLQGSFLHYIRFSEEWNLSLLIEAVFRWTVICIFPSS
jgi:hypothetical protein